MVVYFEEKDLVSFGKYLLSKERKESIIDSEEEVYQEDIENWKQRNGKHIQKNKEPLKTWDQTY